MKSCANGAFPVFLILVALVAATAVAAASEGPFKPGFAGFSVRLKGEINPYEVLGIYALPGELFDLEILDTESPESFRVSPAGGTVQNRGGGAWRWAAPAAAGLYPLEIASDETGRRMTLNAFVMIPFDRMRDGSLNGYRIGDYPDRPLRGLAAYETPQGFVEMTPEIELTLVSPHFNLAQFQCKQSGGPARYVILQERLLLKLERLLAEVNECGHAGDTLFVMSGYRTPAYNAAIGNVKYSRHQWGDGVDIFVDIDPRDGVMDDLDGNGKVDFEDAGVLYRIIDDMDRRGDPAQGGLARYPATSSHGPFVHLDLRGYRARWGR
jgi:hypothetical protein